MLSSVSLLCCTLLCSSLVLGNPTPEQLLAAAKTSPAAVGQHNKQAWLDLFTESGVVHDPVGNGLPTTNRAMIGKFWDAFIAPNNISFTPHFDIVTGWTVMRYVNITAITTSTGTVSNDPAVLRYNMTVNGTGSIQITSLEAYWDISARIAHLEHQKNAAKTFEQLGARLLKTFGLSGSAQYAEAFVGVHKHGVTTVTSFIDDLAKNNYPSWKGLLDSTCVITVYSGDNTKTYPSSAWPSFFSSMQSKVTLEEVYASGWHVAATITGPDTGIKTMALFHFAPNVLVSESKIKAIEFYSGSPM